MKHPIALCSTLRPLPAPRYSMHRPVAPCITLLPPQHLIAPRSTLLPRASPYHPVQQPTALHHTLAPRARPIAPCSTLQPCPPLQTQRQQDEEEEAVLGGLRAEQRGLQERVGSLQRAVTQLEAERREAERSALRLEKDNCALKRTLEKVSTHCPALEWAPVCSLGAGDYGWSHKAAALFFKREACRA